MKSLLVLMTVCAVTLSLAACGSAPASAPAGEETGEKEQQESVANPWTDTTEDEAYTLATTTQDDSELDMQAVAEALYDETKTPGYNMPDEEDESEASESETSESDASGEADYSVAVSPDVADAATVEAYAKEAKEAVLNEDVDWIVKNARYPFYLMGQEIPDADALKEALLADDSPIKSEAFKEKVSGVETEDLFANYQGVMLGDGEIWFGESGEGDTDGLFIFTINGV